MIEPPPSSSSLPCTLPVCSACLRSIPEQAHSLIPNIHHRILVIVLEIKRIETGTRFNNSSRGEASVDVQRTSGESHFGFSSELRKYQAHLLLRNCSVEKAIICADFDIVDCMPRRLRKSNIYGCPNARVTDFIYPAIPCNEGESQRLQRGEGGVRQEMGRGQDEGIVSQRIPYSRHEAE